MTDHTLRFAFAGDRDIAVWILRYLREAGAAPAALLLSAADKASHADELLALCSDIPDLPVLHGSAFRQPEGIARLAALDLDFIIGIHFPYLVPESVLQLPRRGVLNLHPAYLPYNRGWHTPSWAILEGTPVGATLHFMAAGIDTGDIVHQKQVAIAPDDTANTLYQRVKALELELFREAWPLLTTGEFRRTQQDLQAGTTHKRQDLYSEQIQRIDLDQLTTARDLITRLRALTTNQIGEAAYFEVDGRRYRITVAIQADDKA